ncbi:Delta(9)-fatty-acid desaturase fat-7 [Halotydeus destructor]|nr:Delta(9)-fatty-acid desaturase fat-7 [Halotydeus destructor]
MTIVKVSYRKQDSKGPYYLYIKDGDFDLVWLNIALFSVLHVLYIIGLYYLATGQYHGYTVLFGSFLMNFGGFGITVGAHRYWAHNSFKAKWPLELLLMLAQTVAGENCIYIWVRDHKVHHKFSDSDVDPYNVQRGFFFAHMGWLLRRKHPELKMATKKLDFGDLLKSPIVKFQRDYYWYLYFGVAIASTAIPVICWNETIWRSYLAAFVLRYLTTLHGTWFINSACHMFGDRPYDTTRQARENLLVSIAALGEGQHNYHHKFPTDYRTSEQGVGFNPSKVVIDLFAILGLSYDLKVTSHTTVHSVKSKIAARDNPPGLSEVSSKYTLI